LTGNPELDAWVFSNLDEEDKQEAEALGLEGDENAAPEDLTDVVEPVGTGFLRK
jgi:hypothetical protein